MFSNLKLETTNINDSECPFSRRVHLDSFSVTIGSFSKENCSFSPMIGPSFSLA